MSWVKKHNTASKNFSKINKKVFSINHHKPMSLNDNFMTDTCVFFLKPFSMTGLMREIGAVGLLNAKKNKETQANIFL